MLSATDTQKPSGQDQVEPFTKPFLRWNRKLHYYAGLYLLFFLWLFAFTGLLLNHGQWTFAEFWTNRRQNTYQREIVAPQRGSDVTQARDLMRQLGVRGEIEWTTTRDDPNRFDFRFSRPGHLYEIKSDLGRNQATVQTTDLNVWGVIHILHTFTGMRLDDARNQRDWWLTWVWALAMDAVAAGMIFLVLSSLFMWYELPQKRVVGIAALSFGTICCGWFCFGLRWLY